MSNPAPGQWPHFYLAAALTLTLSGPARSAAPEVGLPRAGTAQPPLEADPSRPREAALDPSASESTLEPTSPTRVRAFGLLASAPGEDTLELELLDWRAEGSQPAAQSLLEVEPRGWLDPRRPADEALFAATLGLGVAAGALSVELELRQLNEVVDGRWTTSFVAIGPTLGIELGPARATFSYLPTVASVDVCDPGIVAPRSSDTPRHAARWLVATTF